MQGGIVQAVGFLGRVFPIARVPGSGHLAEHVGSDHRALEMIVLLADGHIL